MLWKPIERSVESILEAGHTYTDFLVAHKKMSEQVPTWTTIVRWKRGVAYRNKSIGGFGLDIGSTPFTKELRDAWNQWDLIPVKWRGSDVALEMLPNGNLHDALKKFIFPDVTGDWTARERKEELAYAVTIFMIDELWNRFCENFVIKRLVYDRVQRREYIRIHRTDYY